MALSDAKVRNAKRLSKPYKISDGEGLFLLVSTSGSKYWRFKYSYSGKEKLLAFGVYPEVSLSDARERRAQARKALAAGTDPSEVKKQAKRLAILKADNNFESIAREWHNNKQHAWAPKYATDVLTRLEADIFPKLGSRPITDIVASELLAALRIVESRGALDLTHRLLQSCGQVFTYGIVTDRATRNPAAELRGALKQPVKRHQPYLKENELSEYLGKLSQYDGHPQTKLALKFLLLTFVRTTELRGALWKEIDFEKSEWRIPAERMKMRDPHIVPLSKQAVAVLRELKPLTGHLEHVFANQHHPVGCMSENTMLYALYRMGYHSRTTGHGFRATASTILNENGFAPDLIERQLAHTERNKVRAAYNHAQYLPERRKMMQWWADYLDRVARKKK